MSIKKAHTSIVDNKIKEQKKKDNKFDPDKDKMIERVKSMEKIERMKRIERIERMERI